MVSQVSVVQVLLSEQFLGAPGTHAPLASHFSAGVPVHALPSEHEVSWASGTFTQVETLRGSQVKKMQLSVPGGVRP